MKKTAKRLLATIMTVVMILTAIPFSGIDFGSIFATEASAKDISSYSVGDIITYGSYPQSKVTDSSTISALDAKSKSWISYGYYSGTGNPDDGNMKPSDYMKYCDIIYNGNRYRAVTFSQYRPLKTGYTSSSNEQQDNGYYTGNVYYFKYEPLKWRVLDPSEGFVMCTTAIDAQAYNNYIIYNSSNSEYYGNSAKTYYASDWANSSLRYWLNNDFYNTAFSSTEKSQIGTTYNENKCTYLSKYDSANTSDKIFLLSYNEVLNSKYGFSSSYSTYDPARQLKSTDYAKCQGCGQSTCTSSYYGNSWWRLRSPYYSCYAAYVGLDGYAYNYYYSVSNTNFGIVPAFKFNPKSTIQNLDYTQSHTVSGFATKNAEYAKSYLSSAGTALGTANDNWVIPGLTKGENMVPQGIAYYPTKKQFLISSYDSEKTDASMIFALDANNGTFTDEYKIQDGTGSTCKDLIGHVGGIAVSGDNIYVANGKYIYRIPADRMKDGYAVATAKKNISELLNGAGCSYVSITDGILWTGNFYDKSKDYNTPAGKTCNSKILGFKLTGSGDTAEWNKFANTSPNYQYELPKSIENIQSATVSNGYIYMTSSYGRQNNSALYAAPTTLTNNTCKTVSANNIYKTISMPLMEGICIKDGNIYSIFESGANEYKDAKNPTDVVWKIDCNKLINTLKNEKNSGQFSFGNWKGKTGFTGDNHKIADEYKDILLSGENIIYKSNIKDVMKSDWHGSCFGIACASALISAGKLHPNYFQAGATDAYSLTAPYYSDTTNNLIDYYYLMQSSKTTKKATRSYSANESENLENLISILNGTSYPVVITIDILHCKDNTRYGSHALVAQSITKSGDFYKIKIYDPNKSAKYLFVKTDYSDSYFTDDSQVRGTYGFDDGVKYYKFLEASLPIETASSTYDFKNIETKLKEKGYSSGTLKTASVMNATSASALIYFNVNYQNFKIECSDGKFAVIKNGQVTDGTLSIRCYGAENDIGQELSVEYSVPGLTSGQTYTVTADGNEISVVTGEEIAEYKTTAESSDDKYYASVSTEENGSVIINYNGTVETKCNNDVEQTIYTARNDASTDWYGMTVSGTTSALKVNQTSSQSKVTADNNADVNITLNNDFNEITFENVDVKDSTLTVKNNSSGDTIVSDSTGKVLCKDKLGSSVVFYSNGGSFVDAITDIENGSKITEPTVPVKEGYAFDGWYISSEFNNEDKWNFGTDTVTEDIKLYAKWVEKASLKGVSNVTLNDITLVCGESKTLEPTVKIGSDVEFDTAWFIEDSEIATVDANGIVTGLKIGTTTLTCTVVDAYGNTVTASCTVTVTEDSAVLGDINADGNINSSDALLTLQHSVGQITLMDDKFTRGDVTKDNQINSSDALKILQYSVGIIENF